MALRMFVQFPVSSPFPPPTISGSLNSPVRLKPPCAGSHSIPLSQPRRPLTQKNRRQSFLRAVDESQTNSESGAESTKNRPRVNPSS
ncbi:hypothetical protein ACFX2H_012480 [Malus domestica]